MFFRKNTKLTADRLGLHGWVKNTARGTVVGQAVGDDPRALDEMRVWLESVGSPKSRIERAEFVQLSPGQVPNLSSFEVVKPAQKNKAKRRAP